MLNSIMNIPWTSGDGYWYARTYDYCPSSGTLIVQDADGDDWEEAEQMDYELDQRKWDVAWKDYYLSVVDTGSDPLENFFIRHSYQQRRCYVVDIREGIGGALVCRWKPKRGQWSVGQMPTPLADYLMAYTYDEYFQPVYGHRLIKIAPCGDEPSVAYGADEFVGLAESADQVTRITKVRRYPSHLEHIGGKIREATIHLWIDQRIERNPPCVARDLKRAARKAIREVPNG
jgi:hypothetical protein